MAQALDRTVVEVALADLEAAVARQRLPDHLDLVVLRRDLNAPGAEVLDRVIGAVMAKAQPAGLGAGGPAHDLVAQADAQQRPAVGDGRSRQGHRSVESRRIAGSGREDQAVHVGARASLGGRVVCGRTRTRAPRAAS